MTNNPDISTNAALVAAFKADHKNLDFETIADGQGGRQYKTNTRCAFVDYVDHLSRDGRIRDNLAQHAHLTPRQPKRSR